MDHIYLFTVSEFKDFTTQTIDNYFALDDEDNPGLTWLLP